MFTLIIFLVILFVLVLVHEFGHFTVAKLFGIRVDEFGIGFPPKLLGKKVGETEYTLNLLPLGGFVRIFGEDPNEKSDDEKEQKRTFYMQPLYAQVLVVIAGVVMNFLLAWVLFFIVFLIGTPSVASSVPKGAAFRDAHLTITEVLPDSPAQKAGLSAGDRPIAVASGDVSIKNVNESQLRTFIASHGGDEIRLTYLRGQDQREATLMPKTGIAAPEENQAIIGVGLGTVGVFTLPPGEALWHSLTRTADVANLTIQGLGTFIWQAVTGRANFNEVAGPVGIYFLVGDVSMLGLSYLLSFVALISINLAVVNIIPFPALDGGRLLMILVEAMKGSPLKPAVTNIVNATGFALLMILILFVTYHDILRYFM